MSGSTSPFPAELFQELAQLRALLETSLGTGKRRPRLASAFSALARIEAGVGQMAAIQERVRELEFEAEQLRAQLREALKLIELQEADLDRLKAEREAQKPNQPERVAEGELKLAFKRVLESCGDSSAANDARALFAAAAADGREMDDAGTSGQEATPCDGDPPTEKPKGERHKRRHSHGRRRLDLTNLPVETVVIDPDEVQATGGEGFTHIGDEVSERLAFKPGSYIRLRIVRRKWVRKGASSNPSQDAANPDVELATTASADAETSVPAVLVAPLPGSVWPHVMADPSAVAQVVESKYDDILPLNRQERISTRQGFVLPRSTQCGWLGAAYDVGYRIVDAMFEEARAEAFCIAMDATGVRVQAEHGGPCERWHVFVFIADREHVVFRYAQEHLGTTVESFLDGFEGYLLADAAAIYDVLYRDHTIIEVGCWFHARRYFWRALESDRARAMEALALISKLFEVERTSRDVPMPARTEVRAQAAKPVLALLDAWVEQHRDHVDPRGPLDKAIGYYENQRDALHRFLDDGRLRLDNNISEGALRYVVLGRHNWQWFANETGLRWYTTFRSLIASCALHGLNPQEYLEQMFRLAPHWPVTRMLELAPKYWARTLAHLDARERASIARPWERQTPTGAALSALVPCLVNTAA